MVTKLLTNDLPIRAHHWRIGGIRERVLTRQGIKPQAFRGGYMTDKSAHSIAEASARSGLGRTSIYELINTGHLVARKCGRRTVVLDVDLQRCLQSLPVKQSSTTPPEGSATDRKDVDKSSTRKGGGMA